MHFFKSKVFSPVICLGFGVWGTPGLGDQVSGVKLASRTFPGLVLRSVQNLLEIGSSGVKEGHRLGEGSLSTFNMG